MAAQGSWSNQEPIDADAQGARVTPEEQKRENRLRLVEDHIGRSLAESERSGELRSAKNFGKPLDFGDGYDETPEDLRMGYKILKDSGFVPPEIELMRDIESLSRELSAAPTSETQLASQRRLSEMRQKLALMMEKLRAGG